VERAVSRIDRYLAREILLPLAISAALVVLAVFLFQARRLATAALGLGLTLEDALVIFVSALPPFLMLAIPISYLLSVLVGLGRLATDLELTALKAAGASPLRIARVPIAAGLLVSLGAIPIAVFGEPYGLRTLHERLVDVGLRNLMRAIQPGVFNEDFRGSAIYARTTDRDGSLRDVLLYDERDPEHAVLLAAKSGVFDTRPEACFSEDLRRTGCPTGNSDSKSIVLDLDDGEMHFGVARSTEQYDRIRFQHAHLGLDAEEEIFRRTEFVSILGRMTMADMRLEIERQRPIDPQLSRRIEKMYWRRFAFPSMALVLGVAGAAIALTGKPRSRARNAVLGMAAVIGYYLLTRIGDFLVVQYEGTPFWCAWVPNLVILAAALAVLTRAGRPV
jgi:lipopolysaccharide export system permease protein